MLGQLVYPGFDTLLISAFLAGIKRTTSLTCMSLELADGVVVCECARTRVDGRGIWHGGMGTYLESFWKCMDWAAGVQCETPTVCVVGVTQWRCLEVRVRFFPKVFYT